MKNCNRIAIILVNYNGVEDSLECIKSIYESNCIDIISVVFVDNASESDETSIVKEKYPEVITIRSNINGGFSAGNNIGIRYALDEGFGYICLLNNDTVIEPDMIELLMNNCEVDYISAPKMMYFSQPNIIWYGGGEINLKTGNAKHTNIDCIDTDEDEIRNVTFATGCCIMIRSETFERVGLLDESFFMYCEDTEFCIRLIMNGIKINYVPKAKLYHKVGRSSGGSDSPFCIYYITRNRLNYVKKYHRFFRKTAYLFSFISRIIRIIQVDDKRIRKAYWQAIKDHMKGKTGKIMSDA